MVKRDSHRMAALRQQIAAEQSELRLYDAARIIGNFTFMNNVANTCGCPWPLPPVAGAQDTGSRGVGVAVAVTAAAVAVLVALLWRRMSK